MAAPDIRFGDFKNSWAAQCGLSREAVQTTIRVPDQTQIIRFPGGGELRLYMKDFKRRSGPPRRVLAATQPEGHTVYAGSRLSDPLTVLNTPETPGTSRGMR